MKEFFVSAIFFVMYYNYKLLFSQIIIIKHKLLMLQLHKLLLLNTIYYYFAQIIIITHKLLVVHKLLLLLQLHKLLLFYSNYYYYFAQNIIIIITQIINILYKILLELICNVLVIEIHVTAVSCAIVFSFIYRNISKCNSNSTIKVTIYKFLQN